MAEYHVFLLEEGLFAELYAEIERMAPVFEYLLAAQQRGGDKNGMASLRQGVATMATPMRKATGDLDQYAKKFYEWLDPTKRSTIRLCMHWQVELRS